MEAVKNYNVLTELLIFWGTQNNQENKRYSSLTDISSKMPPNALGFPFHHLTGE